VGKILGKTMNVFVLCTGRCGSLTFSKACNHIKNYTSSHESNLYLFGNKRLIYPENHIEIDNRLSWFLGELDKIYGDNAYYVHLIRDTVDVAKSYLKRWDGGIMRAYRDGIILEIEKNGDYNKLELAISMCNTINNNIELFLKDKTKKMKIDLKESKSKFIDFCSDIKAEINITNAISEFDIKYNSSK
jgi:hypothetical protein